MRNNNGKNLIKSFIASLILETAFLCGCEADTGKDDIVMTFSEQEQVSSFAEEIDMEKTDMEKTEKETVCIYICGAVARPDVYTLKAGSRLYEAVEMAGGFTNEADDTCVNLARQINDGEQVLILTHEEVLERGEQYMADDASGLVNINTADVKELTSVSGIGESRAKAVIAYREKNGAFSCIEDIKKVDGIKDGLFSKIKDSITVK